MVLYRRWPNLASFPSCRPPRQSPNKQHSLLFSGLQLSPRSLFSFFHLCNAALFFALIPSLLSSSHLLPPSLPLSILSLPSSHSSHSFFISVCFLPFPWHSLPLSSDFRVIPINPHVIFPCFSASSSKARPKEKANSGIDLSTPRDESDLSPQVSRSCVFPIKYVSNSPRFRWENSS